MCLRVAVGQQQEGQLQQQQKQQQVDSSEEECKLLAGSSLVCWSRRSEATGVCLVLRVLAVYVHRACGVVRQLQQTQQHVPQEIAVLPAGEKRLRGRAAELLLLLLLQQTSAAVVSAPAAAAAELRRLAQAAAEAEAASSAAAAAY